MASETTTATTVKVKDLGFIGKLKLLFKIQKPAGELIKQIGDAKDEKRGWKTLGFWITLVGTLGATAGALTGVISPLAQVVATTVLQSTYNILRGAQNANSTTAKGPFVTSEFWLTVLAESQKALVGVQTAGLEYEWMKVSTAVIGTALIAGQNLGMRRPDADIVVAPAK